MSLLLFMIIVRFAVWLSLIGFLLISLNIVLVSLLSWYILIYDSLLFYLARVLSIIFLLLRIFLVSLGLILWNESGKFTLVLGHSKPWLKIFSIAKYGCFRVMRISNLIKLLCMTYFLNTVFTFANLILTHNNRMGSLNGSTDIS